MKKLVLFLILSFLSFRAFAAPTIIPTTIASTASTSGPVNLIPYTHVGSPRPIQIKMSAAWTTASLIFLVSNDSCVTYTELFDGNGNEYVVNAAAGSLILLDPAVFKNINCFELQSVNYDSPPSMPVNQGAARVLNVIANIY